MASADYTAHGAVAVITLNNPPVNALSLNVRKAVADGLERAANAEPIGAVVITGAGA
ncbi:MAG: enoyl-CoA hydratase-related protein, partial [Steroidobacteraceae bacterium]